MAKKSIDFLKEICILENEHTGKVIIEMNLIEGKLTNVKVTPEIRA